MYYFRFPLIALLFLASSIPVNGQDFSTNQLVDLLSQQSDTTRSASGRGVTVKPNDKPQKPSVDIRVEFRYDSAELTTEAVLSLQSLGNALNHPKLEKFVFQIIGHTDAKGSDEYNQKLSEQRANSVANHLIFYHDISKERLAVLGLGEQQLIDVTNPESGVNRRVEIKNTLVTG